MPLIGNLDVMNKTTEQLKAEIADRLTKYLKQRPVVTVEVAEANSYRFSVSGNVAHAGVFSPRHFLTISEAIALAGGPTQYADTGEIVIIRADLSGTLRRIPIDYQGILEGEHPEQDIALVAGDKIYVP
jgi:polysaccharide export outer membrane protein